MVGKKIGIYSLLIINTLSMVAAQPDNISKKYYKVLEHIYDDQGN